MSNLLSETVTGVRHWTDSLFSFTATRDPAFRFLSGQFTMIGLHVEGKPLLRAYSMASAHYDEQLEFFTRPESGLRVTREKEIAGNCGLDLVEYGDLTQHRHAANRLRLAGARVADEQTRAGVVTQVLRMLCQPAQQEQRSPLGVQGELDHRREREPRMAMRVSA